MKTRSTLILLSFLLASCNQQEFMPSAQSLQGQEVVDTHSPKPESPKGKEPQVQAPKEDDSHQEEESSEDNTEENAEENTEEHSEESSDENTEENVGEAPNTEFGDDQCRYKITSTSGGSDIKVTALSMPKERLDLSAYKEFMALDSDDQEFIKNAINHSSASVKEVSSKSINQQNSNETLKIVNSGSAQANHTSVKAGVILRYHLKGKHTNVLGNSFGKDAKLIVVAEASESASIQFTSLGDKSQIFVVFLAQGENTTCVKSTASRGEIASYVMSGNAESVQSRLVATNLSKGSKVTHHVQADKDAVHSTHATRLGSSQIDIKAISGRQAIADVKATSLAEGISLNFDLVGKDWAAASVKGTSVGKDAKINLNLQAGNETAAEFSFTSHSNIEISGKMESPYNRLILDQRLQQSKTAKITVQH